MVDGIDPDLEIFYRSSGAEDGVPIILLHGFPYDHLSYEPVSSLVAGTRVRTIVHDLRRFGRTRLRPGVMRSGQQAALGKEEWRLDSEATRAYSASLSTEPYPYSADHHS